MIIARWPPLALQNQRPLTELVLTSIWVSNHPPHDLPCKKWWGCRFSRRQLDPDTGSTGLQVTSSKSIRPDLTNKLRCRVSAEAFLGPTASQAKLLVFFALSVGQLKWFLSLKQSQVLI